MFYFYFHFLDEATEALRDSETFLKSQSREWHIWELNPLSLAPGLVLFKNKAYLTSMKRLLQG